MNMHALTIRNLTLGQGLPKICVPVTSRDLKELKADLLHLSEESRNTGKNYDLVEWRTDFF